MGERLLQYTAASIHPQHESGTGMTDKDPTEASTIHNLRRLFLLRSLVIGGELAALAAIRLLDYMPLPVTPLLLIIGSLMLINLWTWQRLHSGAVVGDVEFFGQLCADVLALAGVLYFTGGATNPFAWFFLIPLIIAATVLSAAATWLMAALTTACYSLLMFWYVPLPGQEHMHHSDNFAQHVFGMWFGFVLSAALIAWFVVGMAKTIRERDRLLAEAREQALRDEQLIALGTLATGAAHELGTPLATMAVISGELEKAEVPAPMKRKLRILHEQVGRCKQALSVISASAGETRAEGGGLLGVGEFLDTVVAEWQSLRPGSRLEVELRPGPPEARILDEHTLHQSLINLLNNAADASPQSLRLQADWDRRRLRIEILDRGPGLHPAIADELGKRVTSHKESGMGLGLFLTHATLRRLGGDIQLFEREGGGTCTRIELPLSGLPA